MLPQSCHRVFRHEHCTALLLVSDESLVNRLEDTDIIGMYGRVVRPPEHGHKFMLEYVNINWRQRRYHFVVK